MLRAHFAAPIGLLVIAIAVTTLALWAQQHSSPPRAEAQQTEMIMRNISALLDVSRLALGHVVKTTVYLKSMDDFPAMNSVYEKHFTFAPPARACVEVSRLPKDALVEIEVIAIEPESGTM